MVESASHDYHMVGRFITELVMVSRNAMAGRG